MQNCAGDGYAQVIVIADGIIAQITTGGTHNANVLELCKAMQKTWQIAGHNNDNEDKDDNDNDSKWLETLLDAVKQKQSSNYKKCFDCNKKGHKSTHCPDTKTKGGSEKADAVADTSVNKLRSKCSHCGMNNHAECKCWNKYLHKTPRKSSKEASGMFLEEELIVCKKEVNDTYYVTKNVENAYYCVPTLDHGQLEDLESWMGLADLLMADPCKGFYAMSSDKKINDAGLNDWLELQDQASMHDRQMKALVVSHVEDQQRSIQAEASNGAWDPQELGSNK
jgi:hypothetical protein